MMHQRKILLGLLVLIFLCAPTYAQTSAATSNQEELQSRIRQLETQMEAMRNELSKLKESLPPSATNAVETTASNISANAPSSAPSNVAQTASDKRASPKPKTSETEQHRTSGFDLGALHATPYGTIFFNMFGNSGGTNNTDVPLFATPNGTGNVSASARQTRFGLRLEGPQIGDAKLNGAIEADFFGGFPAIGIGENFGLVRLRLAYARLDWKRTALEAGQDWALFAPNNPVSIASAAIPQMAAAGNSWARLPQLRLERRSTSGTLVWQGAVLAPSTGDFPAGANSPALLQPGTGAASRLPAFESRVSVNDKDWFGFKKPGAVGLSVHYGRARVANTTGNNKIDSFGLALDWNMPLMARLTLAGETFFGRNLAGFQGGVFQGFNPDFAYRSGTIAPVAGGPRAIGTRGGWTQLGFTPPALSNHLTVYASYGLDDPRDADLTSLSRRDWRLCNQAFTFSFLYKLSAQLSWGLEFRRFETSYLLSGRQNSNHLNLGAAYSF